MKKKTIICAAVLALAVLAVPTIAFAAGSSTQAQTVPAVQERQGFVSAFSQVIAQIVGDRPVAACAGYVDSDGDGVCDACGFAPAGSHHRGYSDADGDGVCDGCVSGSCAGCGTYADADGDGICDTCGAPSSGGHHRGYVDADGDGVCDNYASGACPGCGGYVDDDGDGVCDNYGSNGRGGCGRFSGADDGSGWGCGAARGHHGRGC